MPRLPNYTTKTFSEIFPSSNDFKQYYLDCGFPTKVHYGESISTVVQPDNITTISLLLYARYGNTPIANLSEEQFKLKVMSIIFTHGPIWEKRLEIQDRLKALSEDEILKGSNVVYNHAFNPSSDPTTNADAPLAYINEQNATLYKKSKVEGYAMLWDILRSDVTTTFLDQFRRLFKQFVTPDIDYIYVTETEEEEDE